MKTEFKRSFLKDLEKARDRDLKAKVAETIRQVESALGLEEIENIKKLKGGDRYFRIRAGNYRIGITVDGELITFVRFLHRKDSYRFFP